MTTVSLIGKALQFLDLSPMAVYAALVSLARSLHQILNLEKYPLHHEEKIVFLQEKVRSILIFLEDYSDKYNSGSTRAFVGNKIRGAAYEAQDFMDSCLCSISSAEKMPLDHEYLNMAVEKVDFIWEEVMKMKKKISDPANDILRSRALSSPVQYHSSSMVQVASEEMVVGFDDDLNSIKERLYEDSAKLQIIPIVGMGGIGKTTLARRAYEEDSLLARDHFDVRSWITISAEHHRKEILSALLRSFKKQGNVDDDGEQSDESDAQLVKRAYQHLVGRRYLIVIDDIWTTKAWDDLKAVFPDNGNGSRILLTTRLSEVAVHAAGSSCTPLLRLNVLKEYQSWKLLQERIFGNESCPPRLVGKLGRRLREIAGDFRLPSWWLQDYSSLLET
ncbi:putative late blight resistance protein homolog R1A-3 [Henckelia pumila]|uniref:putative late blight resistance protein homolog R1A-3 n=1 Tax=Henckelia pumila TaxID=405737 RepID=UPI003C6E2409